jgi:imidazolonepropionase-like amidohydrolase
MTRVVPAVTLAIALHDVTVVDVRKGQAQPHRTVELRDGRIAGIADAATYRAAKDVRLVPMPGRFLVPGFVEMHAHLWTHPWDEAGAHRSQYDWRATTHVLRLLLAHGVTTVRDPGAPTEPAVQLRAMLAEGRVPGPALVTAGRILSGTAFDSPGFAPVRTAEDVRREIQWQARLRVDLIKVYSGMSPELVAVAIEEAHARGLPVVGHLQRTSWAEAARMGIDGLCHAAPWSGDLLPAAARDAYRGDLFARVHWLRHLDLESAAVKETIRLLAERRIPVDLTLMAMHTKFWGDDPRYTRHPQLARAPEAFAKGWPAARFTARWTAEMYREAQAQWPRLLEFVHRLRDGGVVLTVGTDTPTPWIIPGVSYHEELRLLADAGLTPAEVLRAATWNGAVAVRRDREIGSLEAGKRADIVVLRDDPLRDVAALAAIEWIVQGGRLMAPQEIERGEAATAP